MNKNLLICLATVTLSFSVLAQDSKPATPALPGNRPGAAMGRPDRPRPQAGKIIGIDKAGPAITVGPSEGAPAGTALTSNVVVQVSTNTVFLKNGKRVKIDDLTVGDPVRFQVRKTPDGKEAAAFMVIGAPQARPTPAAPATPKK